jgi:hypothetical protein
MDRFQQIVGPPDWTQIEETLGPKPGLIATIMQKSNRKPTLSEVLDAA